MQEESSIQGTRVPSEQSFSTTEPNAKRACLLPDIEILTLLANNLYVFCNFSKNYTVYTIIMIVMIIVTIIVI